MEQNITMGIDIKESLRIAKLFKEKKARGEKINKGEEVILTLATEYVKIATQDFKISNELCGILYPHIIKELIILKKYQYQ